MKRVQILLNGCVIHLKVKDGSIVPEINERWWLPLIEISHKPGDVRRLILELML
jgi:hypothetical protein